MNKLRGRSGKGECNLGSLLKGVLHMSLSLKPCQIQAWWLGLILVLSLPAQATATQAQVQVLPDEFIHVAELVPNVVIDARYAGDNNFVGRPVDGYRANTVMLTRPAAEALAKVSEDLSAFGLGLKVFDGFRPQRAVDHFVRWAADLSDQSTKVMHYPGVKKEHLFRDGYIADRSGHSRGSTVDLTIIDLATGEELPMGTPFDFFGLESWPSYSELPAQQRAFRAFLQQVMTRHGFRPLKEEWWHFTLENEPYPETYFDFPIESR